MNHSIKDEILILEDREVTIVGIIDTLEAGKAKSNGYSKTLICDAQEEYLEKLKSVRKLLAGLREVDIDENS